MSALINAVNGKVTVPDILNRKSGAPSPSAASNPSTKSASRIVCLTAYDYPTARLVDDAGVDIVLVGDSLGMVVLGYEDTLSVTLEDMLHHTRAVHRGVRKALLVTDMPYGSYHVDKSETLRNALRLVKEGGSEAVKIEGGERRMEIISRLVEAEIPVMGHVGLTPQSVHALGGFRVQGQKRRSCRANLARRARRGSGRSICSSARIDSAGNWPPKLLANCTFPPSGSAQGPIAMGRYSCCMT